MRLAFQQVDWHTQWVHLGHCLNCGRASSTAARKARSCPGPCAARSISYVDEPMEPSTPPKMLLTVRRALPAIPAAEAWNAVMQPFPQRSQKNSNWYPLSVE